MAMYVNSKRQFAKMQAPVPTGKPVPKYAQGLIGELMQRIDEPIFGYEAEGVALPVEWQGSSRIVQIAQAGKSCFIVGEPGAGKRTAASLTDLDCDFEFLNTADLASLVSQLWIRCDKPMPTNSIFLEEIPEDTSKDKEGKKARPVRASTKGERAWDCTKCAAQCRVLTWPWHPVGFKDSFDIALKIAEVEGECVLKSQMLAASWENLRERKFITLIQETTEEAIKVYENLVLNATVIILVNAAQLNALEKGSPRLRLLPKNIFPKPTFDVFKSIAEFYGISNFAGEREIAAAAFLSNRNLGEFMNLFRQVAFTLLGLPDPKITTPLLIQTAMQSAVAPSSMALIARFIDPKITTSKQLECALVKTFGITLQPREAQILFNVMQPVLREFPLLTQPAVSAKALPAPRASAAALLNSHRRQQVLPKQTTELRSDILTIFADRETFNLPLLTYFWNYIRILVGLT